MIGPTIEETNAFIIEAHAGQFRRGNEIPYHTHPLAVAVIAVKIAEELKVPEDVIEDIHRVALLHDTIEDTEDDDMKKMLISTIDFRFGQSVLSIINHSMKVSKKQDGNRLTRAKIDCEHYLTGTFRNHNVKLADVIANLEEAHCLSDDFRHRWVNEKRMFVEGLEKLYADYDGLDFQKSLIYRAKVLINRLL